MGAEQKPETKQRSLKVWQKDDDSSWRSNDNEVYTDAPTASPLSPKMKPKVGPQPSIRNRSTRPTKLKQYKYLQRHTVPLKPLQDWSAKRWTVELKEHGSATAQLLEALEIAALDEEAQSAEEDAKVANMILSKMGAGLSKEQWRVLAKFQQTNGFHDTQGEKEYYLDPEMRMNVIFRREFPMGVNQEALEHENRWKFAVKHSGAAVVRHEVVRHFFAGSTR